MAHRAHRVGTEAVPVGRLGDDADFAHVDRGEHDSGIVGGPQLHLTLARVGEDALRRQVAAADRQRLGEAPDAVATHLGPRPVGVEQGHPGGVPVGRFGHEQSVGTETTTAIAQAPGERRQVGHVGVEHDQEVVAEPVVLGEGEGVRGVHGGHTALSRTGSTSATGSCSMSTQRTRGSRRNHRSWRTANWRVRTMTVSTASSSEHSPSRWAMTSLYPRRLACRARQPAGLGQQRRHLADQAGSHHAVHARVDPLGEHRPRPAQPDLHERHGRVLVEPRTERTERPPAAERHLQGADHPPGVARFHSTGGHRVEPDQLTVQRVGPLGLHSGLERGALLGPSAGHLHRVGEGPQVQPGARDEHRSTTAPVDVVDGRRRRMDEVGDGELVGRLGQVDAVVGHPGTVVDGRLRSADVHPPVHLHRVDGHDLDAGMARGERHRHVALARRGRAQHHEPVVHPARTGMRRRCDGSATSSTNRPIRWCGAADVTSTSAYEPTRSGCADGKWTSLFCRVRPEVTDGSFLLGPSTMTSSMRPTRARCLASALRSTTTRKRWKRSAATAGLDEAVAHLGGFGAGPRREDERVRVVVLGGGSDLERPLEVVVGLAGEADDDVGAHGQVVDRGASLAESLEVPVGRVAAVHQRQHAIAARLQRVVQVLAHRRCGRHRREGVGTHVLGVGAGVADAADARHRAHLAQQFGEQRTQPGLVVALLARRQLQVASVAVHVLAEQRHLRDPVGGELAHLGHHVVERPTDLGAAHGGDDAERAVVVAADLDGDPRVVRRLPHGGQRAREHRVVVEHRLVEDLGDRAVCAGVLRPVRRRGARCACRARRRPTAPSRPPDRGPSGPGTRRRRSGDRRPGPSTASASRGCRTACCRRSLGCSTC